MNSDLISELLLDLLNYYDRVSLPGLGSFIKSLQPATISAYGTVISPPIIKIDFKTSEIWDDELLVKKYADHEGISITLAKEEVREQIKLLESALKKTKNLLLPGLGTLSYIAADLISFLPVEALEHSSESYGLEPVNIKPLLAKGEIEQLSGRVYTGELQDSSSRRSGREEKFSVPPKMRAPKTRAPKRIKKPNKGLKLILYIFLILFILAALAAFIYFFREDLRPLLEMVLYNREERELLQLIQ